MVFFYKDILKKWADNFTVLDIASSLDNYVINRIPQKTGIESFTGLSLSLCGQNNHKTSQNIPS